MTTVILVMCPSCGEQEVAADRVLLRIRSHGDASYGFNCSRCHDFIERDAEPRIAGLLRSGGVASVPADIPAEVFEQHGGPPLTLDDVIDFHNHLEQLDRGIPFSPADRRDDPLLGN